MYVTFKHPQIQTLRMCQSCPALTVRVCSDAGHLVMFPSDWSLFDLEPDPVVAGKHIGRSLIMTDPGVAKRVSHQHDWNELEILGEGERKHRLSSRSRCHSAED